ncbi:MAG: DUF1684 domain-containing protein [Acidobacteria bacterium]|nr:DUF1684 domain-containing protein [Acidobacteriota bacterium]
MRRTFSRPAGSAVFLGLAALVAFGASLAPGDGPPSPAERRKAVLADRTKKDAEFRSAPTSPMAAADRRSVAPGETAWLGTYPDVFSLGEQAPPGALFGLRFSEGRWAWTAVNGPSRPRGATPGTRSGEILPGQEFPVGRQTVAAYPSPSGLVLIRFDPDREAVTSFKGLAYFPYRPEFAVRARLVRFERPETVTLLTSRNLRKEFFRYAEIRFLHGGKAQRLTAFTTSPEGPGTETLFIPFRDATTGKGTYPAGRFLEVPHPAGEDLVLDFNTAFNPLCNYADTYNCPRPPEENRLDFPVRAGEKTYGAE